MVTFLCALGLFQILEPKLPLGSLPGTILAYTIKLVLCYLLIGQTDGIISRYYFVLVLPAISAATKMGMFGTIVTSAIAFGAYLSFWLRLPSDLYIEDKSELVSRGVIMFLSGLLAHQLAEATRVESRKYQDAAQRLAEANRSLQEAEAAMRRSERLAALGQLSAGLAHELRNPLASIKGSADLLARTAGDRDVMSRELGEIISSEVDRTNLLVTRFLDFARPLEPRRETADITEIIDRAASRAGVPIVRDYSPEVPLLAIDPALMEQVFINLLTNAA